MPSDLKQRIQAATLKSLTARNRYNDQVTAQLTQALKQAEDEVARAILQYRSLGSLPDNKLAALKGLEKLQLELDVTMKRLKREQTLVYRKSTKESLSTITLPISRTMSSAPLPVATPFRMVRLMPSESSRWTSPASVRLY